MPYTPFACDEAVLHAPTPTPSAPLEGLGALGRSWHGGASEPRTTRPA